jgi:acetyl esterase/lipase
VLGASQAVAGSVGSVPTPFADEQLASYVAGMPPRPAGPPDVAAMRAGGAERVRQRSPARTCTRSVTCGSASCPRGCTGPAPLVVYLHGGGWTV